MSVALRNDEAGCTRKDCSRASRCVRYLGALERATPGIMCCWGWGQIQRCVLIFGMWKVLKNLLKTWAELAPDEFDIDGEYFRLRLTNPIYSFSVDPFLTEISASVLQRYIQRCIKARGWLFSTGICEDSEPNYFGDVWVNGEADFCRHAPFIAEALLYSYLEALAAQRHVTRGTWRHFYGENVEVIGSASWANCRHLPADGGFYKVFESPTKLLAHEGQGEYFSNTDHGDRVFYSEKNGEAWARKTDAFLGLVGANQEHEGLLRFSRLSRE